jgi:hypothetical protein
VRKRDRAGARVRIVDVPQTGCAEDGSVGSRQVAEVTLPRSELDRVWSPEYLERLARTYWRFLTRASLGILRVRYTPTTRDVVVFGRPIVLLRFQAPEYDILPDGGAVTWRIDRGLLVAPPGRGKGYLRIEVTRPPHDDGTSPEVTATVSSEVVSFYPTLAFGRAGRLISRIGRVLYSATQLRIHVIVTHAFLRSLAKLDLAPSMVGALKPTEEPPVTPSVPR